MGRAYSITKWQVWKAYLKVKQNGGAAGVDKESLKEFDADYRNNLYRIWNRMSSGTYFPPPVKGVEIPKKSGGKRLLGVPTVSDRIAQAVAKEFLEPILDPIFHENSYGYRPGRSAHDALSAVRKACWKYDWVIEFDIRVKISGPVAAVIRNLSGASPVKRAAPFRSRSGTEKMS